jgi:hypothetical protein
VRSEDPHVDIGQQQGEAEPNTRQLFALEAFMAGPAFARTYLCDLVYLFALDQTACGANSG